MPDFSVLWNTDFSQKGSYWGKQIDNLGTAMGMSRGDKAQLEYWATNIPYVGNFVRAKNEYEALNSYMSKRGLTWDDVKYPSRLAGAGSLSGIAGAGFNFVSKNLDSFYNEPRRRADRIRESRQRGFAYAEGQWDAYYIYGR